MTRKLASVQRILEISPIPDADRIETAKVLGWQVVIAKDYNLRAGDLVVYFEIDSILPDKPEFEFMRDRKFRIKTIKLKKQISQGLVMPLSILPKNKVWAEGDDVTSVLNVKKYDPEGDLEKRLLDESKQRSKNKLSKFLLQFAWYRKIILWMFPKKRKGGFPSFITKTDEDRIQLFPNIIQENKGKKFIVTEKLDGQSATFFLVKKGNKYEFGVCSRNIYLKKPDDSNYWKIAKMFNIENALRTIACNSDFVILQGEIIGQGIQGNKYGLNGIHFYAFNLIYPSGFVDSFLAQKILKSIGIDFVPVLDDNFELLNSINEMTEYSNGQSVLAPTLREGIVIRRYESGMKQSFKVVSPEFLLKWGL